MKLKELILCLKCDVSGSADVNVTSLSLLPNDCKEGSIFFLAKGKTNDEKELIELAEKQGAVAIVSARKINCRATLVLVKDVRRALTAVCKAFYGNPQNKMKIIGVVGTNGKTTVCELIYEALNGGGIKCGKIGTLGAECENYYRNTGMTTPDAPALYSILSDMAERGVAVVCMEVSAHAIYYKRADFKFDITVFTNCSRDHLDFFGSFERYATTKTEAFLRSKCRLAVVNADDPLGIAIALRRKNSSITYGIEQPSDVFAMDVSETADGLSFIMNLFDCVYDINTSLVGRFNVYNLLAAATACALVGLKTDYIAEKLSCVKPISGRMQKIHSFPNVYVDYAHTPDGLKNALSALKSVCDGRIISVFGCGGNRDVGKRQVMGKISGELSDLTVLTSDNPRFEDCAAIIKEIECGLRAVGDAQWVAIVDRGEAIRYALGVAEKDDCVLIAGKGAEKYREIMGIKLPFSDEEVACAFFNEKEE